MAESVNHTMLYTILGSDTMVLTVHGATEDKTMI
jgi:hypothetical protein